VIYPLLSWEKGIRGMRYLSKEKDPYSIALGRRMG